MMAKQQKKRPQKPPPKQKRSQEPLGLQWNRLEEIAESRIWLANLLGIAESIKRTWFVERAARLFAWGPWPIQGGAIIAEEMRSQTLPSWLCPDYPWTGKIEPWERLCADLAEDPEFRGCVLKICGARCKYEGLDGQDVVQAYVLDAYRSVVENAGKWLIQRQNGEPASWIVRLRGQWLPKGVRRLVNDLSGSRVGANENGRQNHLGTAISRIAATEYEDNPARILDRTERNSYRTPDDPADIDSLNEEHEYRMQLFQKWLTREQTAVVNQRLDGKSFKEIAKNLGFSDYTARSRFQEAMRRLGVEELDQNTPKTEGQP